MAVVGLILTVAFLPFATHAQATDTKAVPGLPVGAKAPAFSLVGQDGKEHALAELLRNGTLVLVFQRSADW